jgi:hypothetical protein
MIYKSNLADPTYFNVPWGHLEEFFSYPIGCGKVIVNNKFVFWTSTYSSVIDILYTDKIGFSFFISSGKEGYLEAHHDLLYKHHTLPECLYV